MDLAQKAKENDGFWLHFGSIWPKIDPFLVPLFAPFWAPFWAHFWARFGAILGPFLGALRAPFLSRNTRKTKGFGAFRGLGLAPFWSPFGLHFGLILGSILELVGILSIPD